MIFTLIHHVSEHVMYSLVLLAKDSWQFCAIRKEGVVVVMYNRACCVSSYHISVFA